MRRSARPFSSLPLRLVGTALVSAVVVLGWFLVALPRNWPSRSVRFFAHYDYPWVRPNVEWPVSSPESAGLDQARLDELRESLRDRRTRALLVARNGRIVYEWYAPGYNANRPWPVASLAKSTVGSMALLTALHLGTLGLSDYAYEYIPAWRGHEVKRTIRIRDLAAHSSGLEDVDFQAGDAGTLEGWKRTYYENRTERFALALSQPGTFFPPGTHYAYSGTGYYALSYAIARSLQPTALPDLARLLEEALKPLGIPPEAWGIGYDEPVSLDGMTLYAIGSGARYTARALAAVGQFMLERGAWRGEQLVEPELVDAVLGRDLAADPNPATGSAEPPAALGWWTNRNSFWDSLPEDAFLGVGAGHQVLLVVPSLELVVVRGGGPLTGNQWGGDFWGDLETHLFEPLMGAVVGN